MANNRFLALCAASALAISAAAAQAATLTLTDISATWFDPAGGQAIKYFTNDTETPKIRWGYPNDLRKDKRVSGYDFDANTSLYGVEQQENVEFDLGAFRHLNYVIKHGTGITGVSLEVEFSFYLDGDTANVLTRSAIFDFAHLETPNGDNPCANGGQHGVGVNVYGCADRVTAVTNVGSSETFEIDGVTYLFDVTGFDMGDEFWTTEQRTNSAILQAQFRTLSDPSPVPLPAGGLLLLGGLGALGVMRRRRKAG